MSNDPDLESASFCGIAPYDHAQVWFHLPQTKCTIRSFRKKSVLSDLKTGIANQKELFGPCPTDLISTIERLNKIILSMLDADEAIAHYTKFIDMLSPVKEESTLEALLTMTRQYRERAERYIGSVSTS